MMHRSTAFAAWSLACLLLFSAGCASYTELPPGTVREVTASPVVEQESLEVAPLTAGPSPSLDYRIGPGDVLFVNVQGKPELGSPVVPGGTTGVKGSRVDGAGRIHLPLIGTVPVAGLTVGAAQEVLREAFAGYLNGPWVVVEVAEYKSQPLYLLGQFKTPGTVYLDRPATLLQGVALGGGLLDAANLRSARLIRQGRTLPIDLFAMLQEGDSRMNVWLQPGDTLFVPDDRNQNVFVFGAVTKPGPVPMPNGRLSLPQALASAGVGETRGRTDFVRIIRSLSPTRGQLLVVDLNQTMQGAALPFHLFEGDIIYVPRSAVGNWNQAISEILPSLQAVSSILQPFVQIKFLQED